MPQSNQLQRKHKASSTVTKVESKQIPSSSARRHYSTRETTDDPRFSDHRSEDHDSDEDVDDDDPEDNDADAPRVVQWQDDEDDVMVSDNSDDDSQREVEERSGSKSNDLSALPFGAFLKARRVLSRQSPGLESNAESGSSSSSEAEGSDRGESSKLQMKDKGSEKVSRAIEKRAHKHAPVEISSKRAVTRRRTVVDPLKVRSRDPRTIPMAGEFSASAFKAHYGFLTEMHTSELSTLRADLKRAKKLLISSPRDLREEREAEVQRLELAVKRTESTVNRDRRERVESEALTKVMKEEREKQREGKGKWWMKDADKKDLLLRARYESLASSGGNSAVKKAIERKRKKVSQKEKKARPFAPSGGRNGPKETGERGDRASTKRPPRSFDQGARPDKRRRVD